MNPEVIPVLSMVVSIVVAIFSALFSFWAQHRIAAQQARFRREDLRQEQSYQRYRLMSRYRDPLLDASNDLQSRIFNIYEQKFFVSFVIGKTGRDHEYGINHTAFVIAQYFGWMEAIRKELRFLDLGDDEKTRQFSAIRLEIQRVWAEGKMGNTCRFFAGVQRAIGERMLQVRPEGLECIGYADFLDRLRD